MEYSLTLTAGQLAAIRSGLVIQVNELSAVVSDCKRRGDGRALWDFALQLADAREALAAVDRARGEFPRTHRV